jgi:hypothetical protein
LVDLEPPDLHQPRSWDDRYTTLHSSKIVSWGSSEKWLNWIWSCPLLSTFPGSW